MSYPPPNQGRFIPAPGVHLGENSRRLDTRCTQVAKYLNRLNRHHFFRLTVSRLAQLFSLHPNTLARAFQRKSKRPLRETLLVMKMEHVKKEIEDNPGISITDLALLAGYESSRHLSTRFKGEYGVTLSEYQKSVRRQRAAQRLSDRESPDREREG